MTSDYCNVALHKLCGGKNSMGGICDCPCHLESNADTPLKKLVKDLLGW